MHRNVKPSYYGALRELAISLLYIKWVNMILRLGLLSTESFKDGDANAMITRNFHRLSKVKFPWRIEAMDVTDAKQGNRAVGFSLAAYHRVYSYILACTAKLSPLATRR